MTASLREILSWQLRTRTLELGRRTLVMGVVNVTPDSFSDGGLYLEPEAAVGHALELLGEGANILDLGAESTRPGSRAGGVAGGTLAPAAHPNDEDLSLPPQEAKIASWGPLPLGAPAVSAEQEQARLLPVLEGILRARPDAIVSVDTYKAATARAALAAGAEIVNDVSGFAWDAEMASVCAEFRCGAVLMHTRGRPEQWSAQPPLAPDELLAAVSSGLAASLDKAAAAGIPPESIVLDPGYGFGKRFEENFFLLARQAELLSLGRPLLAGVSRKSFLGRALAPLHGGPKSQLDAPADQRETASVAALVAAILHGASIVRVHAVRPAVEAARIADAVLAAAPSGHKSEA